MKKKLDSVATHGAMKKSTKKKYKSEINKFYEKVYNAIGGNLIITEGNGQDL